MWITSCSFKGLKFTYKHPVGNCSELGNIKVNQTWVQRKGPYGPFVLRIFNFEISHSHWLNNDDSEKTTMKVVGHFFLLYNNLTFYLIFVTHLWIESVFRRSWSSHTVFLQKSLNYFSFCLPYFNSPNWICLPPPSHLLKTSPFLILISEWPTSYLFLHSYPR